MYDGEFVDLDGPAARPELRRAPRSEPALYRVRVELDGAAPAIWRRLDIRSDAPLDMVHQVIQAAFAWDDAHLHRFSLGGAPFDPGSQLFLNQLDVDDPDCDDVGFPDSAVRLDETIGEPGDVLRYVYDYGDFWELTLRLEAVIPSTATSPTSRLVDGERAAPPEDCGGLTDGDALERILTDASLFDAEAIITELRSPFFVLREAGIDRRLVDSVHRLRGTSVGEDLKARAQILATAPVILDPANLADHLVAYRWFLDRAADGALPLTSAGWLKPAVVAEAVKVIPEMGDWPVSHAREASCPPLRSFRERLQSMRLLRRFKGELTLTKAGIAARRDPQLLWDRLAAELAPATDDPYELQSTLLFLAYAGSTDNADLPFRELANALNELGWRHADGRRVEDYSLHHLPARSILVNVADGPVTPERRRRLSAGAAAVARAALRPTAWSSLTPR